MLTQKQKLSEGPIDNLTASFLIENMMVSNLWVKTKTSFKAGYTCDDEFIFKFKDMLSRNVFESFSLTKEHNEWCIETTLNECTYNSNIIHISKT